LAFAVEVAPRISDRDIIQALANIRAEHQRLDHHMRQGFQAIDQRFQAIDQRFELLERHFNQRFDDMKWFLGIMMGTLLAINTGVLGFVLRRQGSMERSLETVRDDVAFLKQVIERLLPPKPIL
jgi:hypothetical protein